MSLLRRNRSIVLVILPLIATGCTALFEDGGRTFAVHFISLCDLRDVKVEARSTSSPAKPVDLSWRGFRYIGADGIAHSASQIAGLRGFPEVVTLYQTETVVGFVSFDAPVPKVGDNIELRYAWNGVEGWPGGGRIIDGEDPAC